MWCCSKYEFIDCPCIPVLCPKCTVASLYHFAMLWNSRHWWLIYHIERRWDWCWLEHCRFFIDELKLSWSCDHYPTMESPWYHQGVYNSLIPLTKYSLNNYWDCLLNECAETIPPHKTLNCDLYVLTCLSTITSLSECDSFFCDIEWIRDALINICGKKGKQSL